MALTFTPQFHTEVQPGKWAREMNPLAPFGRYPAMEHEQAAFAEAKQIEAEGDAILLITEKP